MHSESVESAGQCQRVALNLTGAEKIDLARGDVLADESAGLRDLALRCVAGNPALASACEEQPLACGLFVATAETIARAIVLDEAAAIARRARVSRSLFRHCRRRARGDRFVVRDETNSRTLGGCVCSSFSDVAAETVRCVSRESPRAQDSAGADAIESIAQLQESSRLNRFESRR